MVDDDKRALKCALFLLKYRPRSRLELEIALKRKEFTADVIQSTIEKLEGYGYVNDSDFARLFVNSRLNRGWGARRIVMAIKRLGVDEDTYKPFLPLPAVSRKMLLELAERKAKFYRGKKNAKQKLMRFLAARGFSFDDIFHVLEKVEC
jgi:regulatory protein